MKNLRLEVRGNQVYDLVNKKNVGEVKAEEKEETQHNWTLRQNRGWSVISGFLGEWVKYWCRSRTYMDASCTTYKTADVLVAEVDGSNFYAHTANNNAAIAYAQDWSYLWVWDDFNCNAYSYAKIGNSTLSITRAITGLA
jgi:hypothetical protein